MDRQVLDDWARIKEVKTKEETRRLKTRPWKRTGPEKPHPVRIAALQGLFDLGEKEARLLLTEWLESKHPEHRAAAEDLSRRVRIRR